MRRLSLAAIVTAALAFVPLAPAAAHARETSAAARAAQTPRDQVVVVRVSARANRLLQHLLHTRAIRRPTAGLASARPGFRILRDGYLPRRNYDDAVGRLYSISADGQSLAECTATVVGKRVVLTAAHCVHDPQTGRDYRGFLFIPGMRGHSAPVGTWTGGSAAYWARWARAPKVSLDYAFVTLDPNQQGQDVGDVTGHYGIVEHARPRRVLTEGYPGTGPFSHNCTTNSCFVTYCYSPLSALIRGAYGDVLGIGCVTGEGSSGGPWFVRFHGRWAIGSVTSVGLRPQHANYFRAVFGPQFDSRLARLLQRAETA